jgi:hypothetical protein
MVALETKNAVAATNIPGHDPRFKITGFVGIFQMKRALFTTHKLEYSWGVVKQKEAPVLLLLNLSRVKKGLEHGRF